MMAGNVGASAPGGNRSGTARGVALARAEPCIEWNLAGGMDSPQNQPYLLERPTL